MRTHKLDLPAPLRCPECDAKVNATAGTKPAMVGDLTICGYCATPLMFTEGLTGVRRYTEAEFDTLDPATKSAITQVRLRILSAKAKRDARH